MLVSVEVMERLRSGKTGFWDAVTRFRQQADLTALANFSGAPSISLPMGLSAAGLPMALQLTAARGRDRRLLEIAAAVEAVLPSIGLPE